MRTPVTEIPFMGVRENSREHDYHLELYSAKLDGWYGERGSLLWRRACEGAWTLSVLKRYCADVRKWKLGDWDRVTEKWFPTFALLELGHIVNYRRKVEAGLIVPLTDEVEPAKDKPAKKSGASKKRKEAAADEPWRAEQDQEKLRQNKHAELVLT